MKDQNFTYTGHELAEPLKELIGFLTDSINQAKKDMNVTDEKHKKPFAFGSVMSLSPYEVRVNEHKRSIIKANNWLRECQRTPSRSWTLDFSDLDWLYRQKINI